MCVFGFFFCECTEAHNTGDAVLDLCCSEVLTVLNAYSV